MKNYIYISVLALSSISSSALSQRVSQQANASVRISWQSREPQRPSYPPNPCGNDHYPQGCNNHEHNRRYQPQPSGCHRDCHVPNQRQCYPENNRNRGRQFNQNSQCNHGYQRGLDNNQCGRLIAQMQQSGFDSDRLILAKQAINGHGVYADQVLRMMQELSFESSRLELAKFAYNQCLDPENYYLVNQGFSFSSSVRELNQSI
ncbi:MAG: hypothetical protein RI977_1533 [Bacteroidota bacterium]